MSTRRHQFRHTSVQHRRQLDVPEHGTNAFRGRTPLLLDNISGHWHQPLELQGCGAKAVHGLTRSSSLNHLETPAQAVESQFQGSGCQSVAACRLRRCNTRRWGFEVMCRKRREKAQGNSRTMVRQPKHPSTWHLWIQYTQSVCLEVIHGGNEGRSQVMGGCISGCRLIYGRNKSCSIRSLYSSNRSLVIVKGRCSS